MSEKAYVGAEDSHVVTITISYVASGHPDPIRRGARTVIDRHIAPNVSAGADISLNIKPG